MGMVPESLQEPFQSLLPRLTRAATEAPTAVYLFSSDETAEIRNLFGYALAVALMQHIPSTLLVDCGYLDVGLSGIVPERDALGFLDLLLYGSSLGVITQETNGGVRVVGAGSFPVTKKMPFVLNAFEQASRRLVLHARCAIYCGPLHDDEGGLHPLIGAVDVPILVRAVSAGAGAVDPIEEQISAQCGAELLSIRINLHETAAEVAPRGRTRETAPEEPEMVLPTAPEEGFEEIEPTRRVAGRMRPAPQKPSTPPQRPAPPPSEPSPAPPRAADVTPPEIPPEDSTPPEVDYDEEELATFPRERKYTSLAPKIATAVVALLVVVFLLWWAKTEWGGAPNVGEIASAGNEQTGTAGAGSGKEAGSPPIDTTTTRHETDSLSARAADTSSAAQKPPPPETAQTGAPSSGTSLAAAGAEEKPSAGEKTAGAIDSDNILVMDDLEANWGGDYLIHVSSFRESSKARSEVKHLREYGFPAFIVYIDLGAKGKWYRVYTGPLQSREAARTMKKNLDDTPGVRFTRITQVPR
jgi:cell division septation protein DedD